jgi:hypothetical protein
MGIVYPLKYIVASSGGNYGLVIRSRYMSERLLRYGLDHTGKVHVPRDTYSDFLRGYVEGCGDLHLVNRKVVVLELLLEDTYDRLNWVQARVHDITGLPKRKVHSKIPGRIKKVDYIGKPALLLLTWLYKDAPIYSKVFRKTYYQYLTDYPERLTLSYNMPCPGSKYILGNTPGEDIVQS